MKRWGVLISLGVTVLTADVVFAETCLSIKGLRIAAVAQRTPGKRWRSRVSEGRG